MARGAVSSVVVCVGHAAPNERLVDVAGRHGLQIVPLRGTDDIPDALPAGTALALLDARSLGPLVDAVIDANRGRETPRIVVVEDEPREAAVFRTLALGAAVTSSQVVEWALRHRAGSVPLSLPGADTLRSFLAYAVKQRGPVPDDVVRRAVDGMMRLLERDADIVFRAGGIAAAVEQLLDQLRPELPSLPQASGLSASDEVLLGRLLLEWMGYLLRPGSSLGMETTAPPPPSSARESSRRRVTRGGRRGTRPPDARRASLFWNSRFPDHPGLVGGERRGEVVVGAVYRFETALEPEPDTTATTTAIDPRRVVGRRISFEFRGTGVSFRPARKSQPWSAFLQSDPVECTEGGTGVFAVDCLVEESGDVVIEARLIVRNGKVADQTIRLHAHARDAAPTERTTPAEPRPNGLSEATDPDALAEMPEVQLRLSVIETGGQYLLVPTTSVGSNLIPVSAASSVPAVRAAAAAARAQLVRRSKSYKPKPDGQPFEIQDAGETMLAFAQVGADLHREIFDLPTGPDANRRELSLTLAQLGRDGPRWQLQVDASDVGIPWSLLYDGRAYGEALRQAGKHVDPRYDRRPERPEDVDPTCFWGVRFTLFHAFRSTDVPSATIGEDAIVVQPVINAALGGASAHQRALFSPGALPAISLDAGQPLETPEGILEWVRRGDQGACDLLYFFCHAWSPAAFDESGIPSIAHNPREAYFGLSAEAGASGARVTLQQLESAWSRTRARRPLVFLHACGSGQDDGTYGRPFIEHFLGTWRARALVGTQWPVPVAFADAFSAELLEAFSKPGTRIADAFRQACKRAFDQDNAFHLIYALFGRFDLHTRERRA